MVFCFCKCKIFVLLGLVLVRLIWVKLGKVIIFFFRVLFVVCNRFKLLFNKVNLRGVLFFVCIKRIFFILVVIWGIFGRVFCIFVCIVWVVILWFEFSLI